MPADLSFMEMAVDLAKENVLSGRGGPFGAVIVKHGRVIASGTNMVTATNDPTAHAEIVAIRRACEAMQSFQLDDCEIYSSCEPCPMCLGAIYWARPTAVYYANTRVDAANAGFDDAFIYAQVMVPPEERALIMEYIPHEKAREHFELWQSSHLNIRY